MNWIVLWTDNAGGAHARLVRGTERDTRLAITLLTEKYADDQGFRHPRVILSGIHESVAGIRAELREYRAAPAA